MSLEVVASKVLGPFFGTSLRVWANVIGVILIAMALGSWLGGRAAERRPEPRRFLQILLLSAVLSALAPFLAGPFARLFIAWLYGTWSARTIIGVGSLSALLLFFAGPVFLLGCSTPFAVRLLSRVEMAGRVAGQVSALSSAGGLLGTLLSTWWLMPLLGSRTTMLLFAGVLFAVVMLGLLGRVGAVAFVVPLLAPLAAKVPIQSRPNQLAERESPYQYVQVLSHGPERRLVFDEGAGVQSSERPGELFSGGYWDALLSLPNLSPAERPRVLILGLAVGSVARGMIESRPEGALSVVGVELDPDVVDLGRQYFSLKRLGNKIEVHVEDARTYLVRGTEKFDFILLDVYANQRYVPPHLVTDEFFALAKAHLNAGGLLVANINAPRDDAPFYRSVVKTLRHNFASVEALKVPSSWNREVIASDVPPDWEGAATRIPEMLKPLYAQLLGWRDTPSDEGGLLLTDDRAPVELMIDQAAFSSAMKPASAPTSVPTRY